MAEERDIIIVSIPFAAGVAAGMLLIARAGSPVWTPASVSYFSVLISIGMVMWRFRCGDFRRIGAWTALMFLAAGLFCSTTSSLYCPSNDTLQGLPEKAVTKLRGIIDSIPYRTGSTGPLVKALLTGDRSGLSKEIVEVFRNSGASHILALSGLHLGMVYLLLTKILLPLGNSRNAKILRYFLIVGASLFYCMMTGAGASLVRAFLFIFLGETAKLTGRERSPVRILLFSMLVQLALKPEVCTSLAFQLSYLAIAGICLIYPFLENLFPAPEERHGLSLMRKIWQGATLSISCQVFTAPLVWFRFHTFPEYFLITNLIALPLTSVIMMLSIATVVLSGFGVCPEVLVSLDDQAIQLLVFCLRVISS